MTHRDSNGITHRDKACPVAVASGRDKPFIGLSLPIRPDAENAIGKVAPGYVTPSRHHKRLSRLRKLAAGPAVLPPSPSPPKPAWPMAVRRLAGQTFPSNNLVAPRQQTAGRMRSERR